MTTPYFSLEIHNKKPPIITWNSFSRRRYSFCVEVTLTETYKKRTPSQPNRFKTKRLHVHACSPTKALIKALNTFRKNCVANIKHAKIIGDPIALSDLSRFKYKSGAISECTLKDFFFNSGGQKPEES